MPRTVGAWEAGGDGGGLEAQPQAQEMGAASPFTPHPAWWSQAGLFSHLPPPQTLCSEGYSSHFLRPHPALCSPGPSTQLCFSAGHVFLCVILGDEVNLKSFQPRFTVKGGCAGQKWPRLTGVHVQTPDGTSASSSPRGGTGASWFPGGQVDESFPDHSRPANTVNAMAKQVFEGLSLGLGLPCPPGPRCLGLLRRDGRSAPGASLLCFLGTWC